jgi:hypothetical protein
MQRDWRHLAIYLRSLIPRKNLQIYWSSKSRRHLLYEQSLAVTLHDARIQTVYLLVELQWRPSWFKRLQYSILTVAPFRRPSTLKKEVYNNKRPYQKFRMGVRTKFWAAWHSRILSRSIRCHRTKLRHRWWRMLHDQGPISGLTC